MIIDAAIVTVDLIPIDSLLNQSLTPSERIKNSLLRSFRRAGFLAGASNVAHKLAATADVVYDDSEYLMKFSVGTPPVEFLATADTGSNLIWIQCEPCVHSFDHIRPLFDRRRSSSYRPVAADTPTCRSLGRMSRAGTDDTCHYSISYGDGSTSAGKIATETVAVGKLSAPNIVIGCGHDNRGAFSKYAAGIVGLGAGDASLINQLGKSIEGKFSYCLAQASFSLEPRKMSKMIFGGGVSGWGVVSTPLVQKPGSTHYHLMLDGITVGNRRLNLAPSNGSYASNYDGTITIDTGTTITYLPPELYEPLAAAVHSQVKLRKMADPMGLMRMCYEYLTVADLEKLPAMTAHFRGGNLKLRNYNCFTMTREGTVCLAFESAPREGMVPVYGNLAQSNFKIGFDLKKMRVSFKPSDCS
ncbi:aspartic proteinase CDR1-like [Andrographis paniculata]|uniref:aspartic proteinase CDR1-like n=1 Tax=Andrographis paniculata TaxID=175694 RepID=UPI0021E85BD3|nr:aspartic proteinase CDR1-like [Andrographis paniculata]